MLAQDLHQGLHVMGLHCQLYITLSVSMPSFVWSGVKFHRWTLEQWKFVKWTDKSQFTIWQSD